MKLYSPEFQRHLLDGIKRAVSNSPELKRQSKRGRPRGLASLLGPNYASYGLYVLFAVGAPTWLAYSFALASGRVSSGLVVASILMLCLVPHHADRLISTLSQSADLPQLLLLPLDDDTIFRRQFGKFLQESVWTLITILLSYYLVLSTAELSPGQWLLAPVIALLCGLTMLALVMLCAMYIPSRQIALFNCFGFLLLLAVVVSHRQTVPLLVTLANQHGPVIELFLPTAWPNALLHALFGTADWMHLIGVCAMLLLLTNLRKIHARFRAKIIPDAYLVEPLFVATPAGLANDVQTDADQSQLDSRIDNAAAHEADSLTTIAGLVGSAEYCQSGAAPKQGWLEGIFWNRLSPREKVLSEFAFPDGYSLTSSWRFIGLAVAVSCLIAWALGLISPAFQKWGLAIGFFISVVAVMTASLGRGTIFEAFSINGVNMPLYAHYPIGFAEVSSLLLKYTLVQAPLIAAYWLFCVGILAFLFDMPFTVALATGVKATVLFLSLRYASIVTAVSTSTNDTSRFNFRSISLLLIVFTLFILFAVFAAYSLVASWEQVVTGKTHFRTWAACALAVGTAVLFHWFYGWFHDSNRFDLVALQPQQ